MTNDGVPYIVMEYVDGQPITAFCNRRRLGLTARLELFQQICKTVAHAHINLVVHRDLKPSNILITADGTPKLLDFGIAKLIGPDQVSSNTLTDVGAMTPEYASPEQIRGEAVTTVSDVYSLGVILYELLTGQRPYRPENGSRDLRYRDILEYEPSPPSSIKTGDSALKDVALTAEGGARSTREIEAPFQIVNPRSLRGDLDNIALKALRKTHRDDTARSSCFPRTLDDF